MVHAIILPLLIRVLTFLSVDHHEAYFAIPDEMFFSLPKSDEKIDLTNPDTLFLDAAIFHATNEARIENHLPPFQYDFSLYKAASNHANSMTKNKYYSHFDPYSSFEKTVVRRVDQYTKRFRRIAENIGRYQTLVSGEWIMVSRNSKTGFYQFRNQDDSQVCEPFTYAEFARFAVEQWMMSPPHRANMMNIAYTHVGCSAALSSDPYKERRPPYASLVQNFGAEN